MAPPPESTATAATKKATVYYTWLDDMGNTQTGNTTFSVSATGLTSSAIEQNLKNAYSKYLSKIEEDIVYDILTKILPSTYYTIIKNSDYIEIIELKSNIPYYINFPITFPITFPLIIPYELLNNPLICPRIIEINFQSIH